jgi:hypothetical protein
MFVQIIVAEDVDEDILEVLDRWEHEVRPGAIGWLGTTAGLTPDGNLVVAARFASEEEARRNSERPEQDAWWAEVEKQLSGGVRFHDCREVATALGGGDDGAGFVQVMESRPSGPVQVQQIADDMAAFVGAYRPDVIGGLIASDGDRLFQLVYFTSEADARAAEAGELPPEAAAELEAELERWGPISFHDLTEPLLRS